MQIVKDSLNTFQLAIVSEMENGWLLVINEKDDFDLIETLAESYGDIHIIGTYNLDGTQYQWVNPNSNRNHTIAKYTNKLKPKKVWNEQSQNYDEIPYTEITALDKQVNLIYGHPKRILIEN